MTAKILVISDDAVPSGFGRISMETNIRLSKRGYQILALSLQYDALLPASYDGQLLSQYYHVGSLAGKPNWPELVANVANVYQPDIVMVTQDAPYGETVRNLPLDWSHMSFIMVTPVDGTPIRNAWVDVMRKADAALTISEFGVKGYAKQGVQAGLLRPGVDLNTLYRLNDDERATLRAKLGLTPDAFVFGMFSQHQGRKNIPDTLRIFYRFAQDKPTARLYLDMEPVSPAGWDIPDMCRQNGWDFSRIMFRADVMRAGIVNIRERYNVLDAHAVISHREGWGLPLVESMACGVPTMALDWCSGTEIVGDGKGLLVKPIEYTSISTWGNGLDKFPDIDHAVSLLQNIYDNPAKRTLIGDAGMKWARTVTWDAAADAVQAAIERVLAKRRALPTPQTPPQTVVQLSQTAQPQVSPDGIVQKDVVLQEA